MYRAPPSPPSESLPDLGPWAHAKDKRPNTDGTYVCIFGFFSDLCCAVAVKRQRVVHFLHVRVAIKRIFCYLRKF